MWREDSTACAPVKSAQMTPSYLLLCPFVLVFGTEVRVCFPRMQEEHEGGVSEKSTGIPVAIPRVAIFLMVETPMCPIRRCHVSSEAVFAIASC